MKKYSPRPGSTPPTGALKGGVKYDVSTARSKSLLSNKGSGIYPNLRHLRPRFLEGLTQSELKSVLAEATYRRFRRIP